MLKLILISLVVLSPERAGGEFFANEELLVEKALTQLYGQYNADEYRFELKPRWIPNSLQEVNPSKILSLQIVGEVSRYTIF